MEPGIAPDSATWKTDKLDHQYVDKSGRIFGLPDQYFFTFLEGTVQCRDIHMCRNSLKKSFKFELLENSRPTNCYFSEEPLEL